MAVSTQRKFNFDTVRRFGRQAVSLSVPELTTIQTESYKDFLQEDVEPLKRENKGLEAVLRESFPIVNFNESVSLNYEYYELEKPRFTPDECRRLKLTYGRPLRIRVRLDRPGGESISDTIYLGDMPIMFGGGEFIINGAERVVVTQLHRSPGIDYIVGTNSENRKAYSCRIVPERGCWVEFLVTRKEGIQVRVDQNTKLPLSLFLRAMDEKYGTDADVLRAFYPTTKVILKEPQRGEKPSGDSSDEDVREPVKKGRGGVKKSRASKSTIEGWVSELEKAYPLEDVVYPAGSNHAGEVIVGACKQITRKDAETICASGIQELEVIFVSKPLTKLILTSVLEGAEELAKRSRPAAEPAAPNEEQNVPVDENASRTLVVDDPSRTLAVDDASRVTVVDEAPRPRPSKKRTSQDGHNLAVLYFYSKVRPGNPPDLKKATDVFNERFYDTSHYRLGAVGRFRMNRKLGTEVPEDALVLSAKDVIDAVTYLCNLWSGVKSDDDAIPVEIDDIDNLGNRRLRTVGELLGEELRSAHCFQRFRRTVSERLSEDAQPKNVINTKSISAAIEAFFGRGELSQVVDQTNPLSMLTHERRLSALGPGGLNRKRAGYEVRDVHPTHYGRICPIETPEGTNIGLISSLAVYSSIDHYGFLVSPYRKVVEGKITEEIEWLRADEEYSCAVLPADTDIEKVDEPGFIGLVKADMVTAREKGDYKSMEIEKVKYIDVSPNQMIGVSAGLIPFLEHDDANRALMGANMQRQAVPLLQSEAPLVGTGMEKVAAENSSLLVRAKNAGKVTYVDAEKIIINDTDLYEMRKFVGLNERTCQNQKPIVLPGQEVEKGQVIADGACTDQGVLALGKNVLVAFMVWDGYNYEDAIIISEELVQKDTYTSIHIESHDIELRELKDGREEFTPDIPNVSERMKRNLDENGIVRVGSYVRPDDILVGKVAPKIKKELTPEEKLLYAIFGRSGEDVKNESLTVPAGSEGIVIGAYRFRNRSSLNEDERKKYDSELAKIEKEGNRKIAGLFGKMIGAMRDVIGRPVLGLNDSSLAEEGQTEESVAQEAKTFHLSFVVAHSKIAEDSKEFAKVKEIYDEQWPAIEKALDERDSQINSHQLGDQLRRAVLQMVKVYIATKRVISVGDKMAGRHGNKGVISRILPKEDMPFLEDGTPIQIMLNPLGVPSRMNVGQILETHLGWAAKELGYRAVTPVFDGATEPQINEELKKAGLPSDGKVQLYDGRTGEPFAQKTTVGYIYMLKLHHLVDDKVHARSVGPYSLITQQPLGGKARSGGQRFGEMEFWALEAYGAAYTIQELLTVKSDDVDGRIKIYESMVKGENTLEAGIPASFDVLANEIKGLALDMRLVNTGERKAPRVSGNDLVGF